MPNDREPMDLDDAARDPAAFVASMTDRTPRAGEQCDAGALLLEFWGEVFCLWNSTTDAKVFQAARVRVVADFAARLAHGRGEMARLRAALEQLTVAVENMKVPQTIADAGLQIFVTLGPAVESARAALADTVCELRAGG